MSNCLFAHAFIYYLHKRLLGCLLDMSPCDAEFKVLHCVIVLRKFEFQSLY